MRKIFSIAIIIVHFLISEAFALKTDTHKKLNLEIITSQTNLDNFLINGLNFHAGINQEISFNGMKQRISYWLRDGGRYEDEPPLTFPLLRCFRHFHNPLSPITIAGYGISDSAVLWSQRAKGTQSPGGYYSWRDAREYYYLALTATSQTTREENFANTFRAVGQVMHLLQDMSVPEHTRNDGHVLPAYESWVASSNEGKSATKLAIAYPISFDISALLQPSPFTEAPIPIARLFDSETYTGNNPEITTIDPNIGLSEYTNANFLSGDTMFTDNFPYPSRATSVRVENRNIPDPLNPGSTVVRPYFVKVADGETGAGGKGYLLAGVDYLSFYRNETNEFENAEIEIIPPMDDYVFADYAQLLLPRAVGYSATLLHYFFRGKLETTAFEKLDETGNVTELLVNVKNTTSNHGLGQVMHLLQDMSVPEHARGGLI